MDKFAAGPARVVDNSGANPVDKLPAVMADWLTDLLAWRVQGGHGWATG